MRAAEWRVLILLVLSVFINYIDRANLSIAAPLLEKEMSLSPVQIGDLLGAFFWTYALFQLFGIAGWLVDRYDVGLVFAAGFFLWSGATAATGMLSSFPAMFAMRLLLGAGESVAYPCYSKILARDFPEHHRGLANALIDAGSKMGPALGTLARWSAGGATWLAHVLRRPRARMHALAGAMDAWRPRGHHSGTVAHADMPGVMEILRLRSAWGTFFGLFCANYFWYFLLTWLPLYLVKERHFSMERMATVGSLAYFAIAVTSVTCGWLARSLDSLERLGDACAKDVRGRSG